MLSVALSYSYSSLVIDWLASLSLPAYCQRQPPLPISLLPSTTTTLAYRSRAPERSRRSQRSARLQRLLRQPVTTAVSAAAAATAAQWWNRMAVCVERNNERQWPCVYFDHWAPTANNTRQTHSSATERTQAHSTALYSTISTSTARH